MTETHRIRWYVKAGDDFIPRTKTMRGEWDYDVRCSCGWESRTGGATERSVRRSIVDHRRMAKFYDLPRGESR